MFRIFLQETYEVLDAIFYDKALNGTGNYNDNWRKVPNITELSITRNSDGTLLDYVSTSSQRYIQLFPRNTPSIDIDVPYIVEFDIVELNGYVLFQAIGKDSTNTTRYYGRQIVTGHIKVELQHDSVKMWADNVNIYNNASYDLPTTANLAFVFDKNQGNASLKYKNFKVYPI